MSALADVDANGFIGPKSKDGPPMQAQVDQCRAFIQERCVKRKSFNTRRDSYALKHDVERWTRSKHKTYDQVDDWGRAWACDYFYVSNGAFIRAAMLEGYRVKRIANGPNAVFDLEVQEEKVSIVTKSQYQDEAWYRFRAVNFARLIGAFRQLKPYAHQVAAARWLFERGWTTVDERMWRDPCTPHDVTGLAFATMTEVEHAATDILRAHGWTTNGWSWLSPDGTKRVRSTRDAFERMWLSASVEGREQIEVQLHSPRLDLGGRS